MHLLDAYLHQQQMLLGESWIGQHCTYHVSPSCFIQVEMMDAHGEMSELYNAVEPVFDGTYIRLSLLMECVCPGTFVLFSNGDECMVAVSGELLHHLLQMN